MTIEEWKCILDVAQIDEFTSLPATIQKAAPEYASMWQNIFRSSKPLEEAFPPPWDKLSMRQKVILMRATCPNAFVSNEQAKKIVAGIIWI